MSGLQPTRTSAAQSSRWINLDVFTLSLSFVSSSLRFQSMGAEM